MSTENIKHDIEQIKTQKNLHKEKIKRLELKLQQQKTRLSKEKEVQKRKKLNHIKSFESYFEAT